MVNGQVDWYKKDQEFVNCGKSGKFGIRVRRAKKYLSEMRQFESTAPAEFCLENANGIGFLNLRTSASFLRKMNDLGLFYFQYSLNFGTAFTSN